MVGRYVSERDKLDALAEEVRRLGIDHLLDVALDHERDRVVWPKHVWWCMHINQLAERVPGTGRRPPRNMHDVWRLTLTGRAELGRRKMERETGFEAAQVTPAKARDADVVVFERPDAEWNF
jgi:hypothetical protein